MTEVLLKIPDETANKLLINLPRSVTISDIVVDAVALYAWAIDQKTNGRVIFSANADLTDAVKLTSDI